MKILRASLTFVLVAALGLGGTTLLALESTEVVILRTQSADRSWRATRAWVASDGAGRVWLEANNPQSPWLLDVMENPTLELERGGETLRYRAQPDPSVPGHTRIRSLMAAKYGWADRWVGMLFGNPHSVAVRLLKPLPSQETAPLP